MKRLILLSLLSLTLSFSNWCLSVSQSEINKPSNYTFSLCLSSAVTSSSKLLIQFPGDFAKTSLKSSSCNPVFNLNPGLFTVFTGLNVTLSQLYESSLFAGELILFTITSVININIAKTTESFKIYSLDSYDNILESLTNGITITFTPKLLNFFSIKPSTGVSGSLST